MRNFTKEVLYALVSATKGSLGAHVPAPAILCKFRKDRRGSAKRELRKIEKLGLAIRHPTRGEMTWRLTKDGLSAARKFFSKKTH